MELGQIKEHLLNIFPSVAPIEADCGDLVGVDRHDPSILTSPLIKLRWLDENSPYWFETFVILSKDNCWQGVNIFLDEDLENIHHNITVVSGGGDTGNIGDQIYIHNKFITDACMDFIDSGEIDFNVLENIIYHGVEHGS